MSGALKGCVLGVEVVDAPHQTPAPLMTSAAFHADRAEAVVEEIEVMGAPQAQTRPDARALSIALTGTRAELRRAASVDDAASSSPVSQGAMATGTPSFLRPFLHDAFSVRALRSLGSPFSTGTVNVASPLAPPSQSSSGSRTHAVLPRTASAGEMHGRSALYGGMRHLASASSLRLPPHHATLSPGTSQFSDHSLGSERSLLTPAHLGAALYGRLPAAYMQQFLQAHGSPSGGSAGRASSGTLSRNASWAAPSSSRSLRGAPGMTDAAARAALLSPLSTLRGGAALGSATGLSSTAGPAAASASSEHSRDAGGVVDASILSDLHSSRTDEGGGPQSVGGGSEPGMVPVSARGALRPYLSFNLGHSSARGGFVAGVSSLGASAHFATPASARSAASRSSDMGPATGALPLSEGSGGSYGVTNSVAAGGDAGQDLASESWASPAALVAAGSSNDSVSGGSTLAPPAEEFSRVPSALLYDGHAPHSSSPLTSSFPARRLAWNAPPLRDLPPSLFLPIVPGRLRPAVRARLVLFLGCAVDDALVAVPVSIAVAAGIDDSSLGPALPEPALLYSIVCAVLGLAPEVSPPSDAASDHARVRPPSRVSPGVGLSSSAAAPPLVHAIPPPPPPPAPASRSVSASTGIALTDKARRKSVTGLGAPTTSPDMDGSLREDVTAGEQQSRPEPPQVPLRHPHSRRASVAGLGHAHVPGLTSQSSELHVAPAARRRGSLIGGSLSHPEVIPAAAGFVAALAAGVAQRPGGTRSPSGIEERLGMTSADAPHFAALPPAAAGTSAVDGAVGFAGVAPTTLLQNSIFGDLGPDATPAEALRATEVPETTVLPPPFLLLPVPMHADGATPMVEFRWSWWILQQRQSGANLAALKDKAAAAPDVSQHSHLPGGAARQGGNAETDATLASRRLTRREDFVMITEATGLSKDGGAMKKAVVFRAKQVRCRRLPVSFTFLPLVSDRLTLVISPGRVALDGQS